MRIKKNPFKKTSMVDTLINVGIGGASNVAIDAAVVAYNKDATTPLDPTYIHVGKIVLGVLGGSMVSNKYLRAGADGVATVGVSNLIQELMAADQPETTSGAAGFMSASVGRMRPGKPRYSAKAKRRVSGVSGTADLVG